jgi:sugar lactone lactonase YvrE
MKKSIVGLSFWVAVFLTCFRSDLRANPGDLYSGQLSHNEIDKFTPAGAESVFVSGFFADALAFDGQANLFVADTQGGKIRKVTLAGVVTDFATIGNPMGLAFDATGNLFVSDASTGSIIKLTPTGASSTFATGLSGPFGLAFDRTGNLFVSEANTGMIVKFTPAGAQTPFASGLSTPEGLAFDSAGNLYEVDFSSGVINKFGPDGTKSNPPFATGLLAARHIAIDQNNNVFVANFGTQEIFKFTPAGTKTPFAMNTNSGGLAFEPVTSTLANISTRALVQTGNHVLIGGFAISGSGPKKVLIRAIGPTLANFSVPNPLQDPMLSLHDTTMEIANNDNWQTDPNASQIPANLQPTDPRESAILTMLQPGLYTAIVSGKGGTSGVALVEVYDMDSSNAVTLTNLSTRGVVQTGDFVMIGGFVTAGAPGSSTQVLIRAIGPSLTQFGISDALADPTVRLFNANGVVIGSNDNWKDTQQAEIQATGNPPTNDLESAILITLPPGGYTAIVTGKNGGIGVGLVEVFKER